MQTERPSWLRAGGSAEQSAPRGSTLLFVCTGNICRSAFAQAYARARLSSGTAPRIGSAGIAALTGQGMDPLMAEQARAAGIAGAEHVARQLTGRMLKEASVVFVFGPEHVRWIEENHPTHLGRVVGLGHAAHVLARMSPHAAVSPDRVPELVSESRGSDAPAAEQWIADPYRRGEDAAREAALRIRECFDIVTQHVRWNG